MAGGCTSRCERRDPGSRLPKPRADIQSCNQLLLPAPFSLPPLSSTTRRDAEASRRVVDLSQPIAVLGGTEDSGQHHITVIDLLADIPSGERRVTAEPRGRSVKNASWAVNHSIECSQNWAVSSCLPVASRGRASSVDVVPVVATHDSIVTVLVVVVRSSRASKRRACTDRILNRWAYRSESGGHSFPKPDSSGREGECKQSRTRAKAGMCDDCRSVSRPAVGRWSNPASLCPTSCCEREAGVARRPEGSGRRASRAVHGRCTSCWGRHTGLPDDLSDGSRTPSACRDRLARRGPRRVLA